MLVMAMEPPMVAVVWEAPGNCHVEQDPGYWWSEVARQLQSLPTGSEKQGESTV